jgi:X-Pro dipeptidyl-peptidase
MTSSHPISDRTRQRHHRARRGSLLAAGALVVSALVAPVGSGLAAASTPADADTRPWVSGDHTMPVFDIDQAITEVVNVETGMDGDEDGDIDTIRVNVTRPDTAADARVPLIVHASPYFAKGSRSAWETGYFVPRGYAVATVALPGTDFSTGCSDVGADLEVLGSKAVVDWANGRAKGFHLDGSKADATTWTNGKVGMIGVSWDGTIANAVASTGVQGLKTIVPVAAISSWYDYTRSNGVTYYDDHIAYLHEFVSNFDEAFCHTLTPILQAASDDATSSYNDWWSDRDYRLDASKITASVFVVHGLNDENVKTGQFGYWWDQLVANDVERKIFLHQGVHVEPHFSYGAAYDQPLTEWFDYYLQGLGDNPTTTRAIIQREDGTWSTDAEWPPTGTQVSTMKLSKPLDRAAGGLSTDGAGDAVQARTAKIVQTAEFSSDSIVANPTDPRTDRAVFLSRKLTDAIRESGTASVRLKVKVNQPLAAFQARVVDYTSSGSAFIVSRTMASLNHHAGLDQYETLTPGKYYSLTWNIHTDDRIFKKDGRLGLVITPERQNIEGSYTPFKATIKLDKSWLKMPFNGDTAPSGLDAVAPSVGTSVANVVPRQSIEEFTHEFLYGSNS